MVFFLWLVMRVVCDRIGVLFLCWWINFGWFYDVFFFVFVYGDDWEIGVLFWCLGWCECFCFIFIFCNMILVGIGLVYFWDKYLFLMFLICFWYCFELCYIVLCWWIVVMVYFIVFIFFDVYDCVCFFVDFGWWFIWFGNR